MSLYTNAAHELIGCFYVLKSNNLESMNIPVYTGRCLRKYVQRFTACLQLTKAKEEMEEDEYQGVVLMGESRHWSGMYYAILLYEINNDSS